MDHSTILGCLDGRNQKLMSVVRQIHDDVISRVFIVSSQIRGVSLQDLQIDFVQNSILPKVLHCYGVLVDGNDPCSSACQQQGKRAHPCEHIKDEIARTNLSRDPQPLSSQAWGEICSLQVNPVAKTVLLMNGDRALFSGHVPEPASPELTLHIRDGRDHGSEVLA